MNARQWALFFVVTLSVNYVSATLFHGLGGHGHGSGHSDESSSQKGSVRWKNCNKKQIKWITEKAKAMRSAVQSKYSGEYSLGEKDLDKYTLKRIKAKGFGDFTVGDTFQYYTEHGRVYIRFQISFTRIFFKFGLFIDEGAGGIFGRLFETIFGIIGHFVDKILHIFFPPVICDVFVIGDHSDFWLSDFSIRKPGGRLGFLGGLAGHAHSLNSFHDLFFAPLYSLLKVFLGTHIKQVFAGAIKKWSYRGSPFGSGLDTGIGGITGGDSGSGGIIGGDSGSGGTTGGDTGSGGTTEGDSGPGGISGGDSGSGGITGGDSESGGITGGDSGSGGTTGGSIRWKNCNKGQIKWITEKAKVMRSAVQSKYGGEYSLGEKDLEKYALRRVKAKGFGDFTLGDTFQYYTVRGRVYIRFQISFRRFFFKFGLFIDKGAGGIFGRLFKTIFGIIGNFVDKILQIFFPPCLCDVVVIRDHSGFRLSDFSLRKPNGHLGFLGGLAGHAHSLNSFHDLFFEPLYSLLKVFLGTHIKQVCAGAIKKWSYRGSPFGSGFDTGIGGITGGDSGSGGITGGDSGSGGITGGDSGSGEMTEGDSGSRGITGGDSGSGGMTKGDSGSGGMTEGDSGSGGITGGDSGSGGTRVTGRKGGYKSGGDSESEGTSGGGYNSYYYRYENDGESSESKEYEEVDEYEYEDD